MATITKALAPEGAMVSILVGWSASGVGVLRAALRPVPSPIHVQGLVDTGAEVTCIDSSLVFLYNGPRRRFRLAY